ncbi:hypothetical protein [Acidianus sp. HS-5]|uniref:hypothetical protein n=1 Tax=Acidianus sp. HS-5 TaxID=2886040 RepID=UPI001F395F92|nr:hypothetical protein [Acidianus sp. HS-5]
MQPYNESTNSTAIALAEEQLQRELSQLCNGYCTPIHSLPEPWYIQYLPEIIALSVVTVSPFLYFLFKRIRMYIMLKRMFRS